LFTEIKRLGYTGCYTHLARFIASWWRQEEEGAAGCTKTPAQPLPREPTTGRLLLPLTAAALCIKPRPELTARQAAIVDALKIASPEFASMRQLAMQLRGILRSGDIEQLDRRCQDASRSSMDTMPRFAKALQWYRHAVQNALIMPWSNGQTEGQISRPKTLKRSMYDRAGAHLPRARLLPL
jgi:transposase